MKITGTGTDEAGAQYDIVITARAPQPPAETLTTLTASTTTNPGNLTLTASVAPLGVTGAVAWSIDGEPVVTAPLLEDGTATWVVQPLPDEHAYGALFEPADPARWKASAASIIYTKAPPKPWSGATAVVINGNSYPYSGTNVPRGTGRLVGFDTTWPHPTTGVNEWGSEVLVLDGKVVGPVVNGQRGGMAIQPDLILSGHEEGARFLRDNARTGVSVTFRHA